VQVRRNGFPYLSSESSCCSLLVLKSLKASKAVTTFLHEFHAVLLCTMQKVSMTASKEVHSMREVSLAMRHRHRKALVTDLMTVPMSADVIQ
jgi:hypothetical protein